MSKTKVEIRSLNWGKFEHSVDCQSFFVLIVHCGWAPLKSGLSGIMPCIGNATLATDWPRTLRWVEYSTPIFWLKHTYCTYCRDKFFLFSFCFVFIISAYTKPEHSCQSIRMTEKGILQHPNILLSTFKSALVKFQTSLPSRHWTNLILFGKNSSGNIAFLNLIIAIQNLKNHREGESWLEQMFEATQQSCIISIAAYIRWLTTEHPKNTEYQSWKGVHCFVYRRKPCCFDTLDDVSYKQWPYNKVWHTTMETAMQTSVYCHSLRQQKKHSTRGWYHKPAFRIWSIFLSWFFEPHQQLNPHIVTNH